MASTGFQGQGEKILVERPFSVGDTKDAVGDDAFYRGSDEEQPVRYGSVSAIAHSDYTLRRLKPRHIQLIGIGGTIGTALFVTIGQGLIAGGPASLFLAFTIWYVLPNSSVPPANRKRGEGV